ncbi:cell division protein FtsQ/DivIB [Streptomyces sp. Isolate_219]|uniref:cell division protein FtsQ/DivIB n=1 Tax=Streptomyces sp. Isolate_219 TaxID=2950110 RepID=UPI0021C69F61|nr:FtsQ-type POTRA domain-containing protein [Streptomyces sp. Isolate_219]MCR8578116.1 FtsQ-type POTRA domain-containing protein [Streptomyces sp. Isolate_219]
MAGPTTAQRGEKKSPSGPPSAAAPPGRRFRWERLPLRAPSRRGLIIILVVTVLLGAFGVWALYASDWLRAERVSTTGTKVLTPHEVVAAADAPMNAPLASVDTDALARRLRARLPRIKMVDVERSWPHTIGLKVTERVPELLMRAGGKFVEVDAEGVRFATVGTAPKGVPLLEMTASDSPSLRRFGIDRLRRAAVKVAQDLPAVVHKDVRKVRVRSYDAITLELDGDRTVAWGSREQGPEKAKVLTALLKAAPGGRHFDISVPSAPAVSGS